MLAIGRALVTQPSLLMLDEPSLGLAPFLVAEIFGILQKINQEEGMSVLLVEQNALAALEIVSEGYLIENGRVVMNGTAAYNYRTQTHLVGKPVETLLDGGAGVNGVAEEVVVGAINLARMRGIRSDDP